MARTVQTLGEVWRNNELSNDRKRNSKGNCLHVISRDNICSALSSALRESHPNATYSTHTQIHRTYIEHFHTRFFATVLFFVGNSLI